MKKYEWNEDTIDYFQFTSCYTTKACIYNLVTNFIESECQMEDGDTEEEMIDSLMDTIYK